MTYANTYIVRTINKTTGRYRRLNAVNLRPWQTPDGAIMLDQDNGTTELSYIHSPSGVPYGGWPIEYIFPPWILYEFAKALAEMEPSLNIIDREKAKLRWRCVQVMESVSDATFKIRFDLCVASPLPI